MYENWWVFLWKQTATLNPFWSSRNHLKGVAEVWADDDPVAHPNAIALGSASGEGWPTSKFKDHDKSRFWSLDN